MGYHVNLISSDVFIPAEFTQAAFDAVCALNAKNDLKYGGRFGGYHPFEKPADTNSNGDPDRWFSWLPWNYDEICEDIVDVLDLLGFSVDVDLDGCVYVYGYDSKSGQEDLFFKTLAPYIRGSQMTWMGEDSEFYVWVFEDGKFYERPAHLTW